MQFRELSVAGAFEVTPNVHTDDRGAFLEWYKASAITEAVGHPLDLRQANCSISAAGVLRGIHCTVDPPGQAKFVSCVRGAFLDVVIDLRQNSPTFGKWDSAVIDDTNRKSVYLPAGLGHAILSLDDESTVIYLCSAEYQPGLDFDIDAFDPEIGIEWPTVGRNGQKLDLRRSPKDEAAPTLAQVRDRGLLPG